MSELVQTFRDIGGDQLRALGTMGPIDYELKFIRDELEDIYSDSDLDDTYLGLMSNQIVGEDLRQAGDFRKHEAQIFLFEDIIVFLFPVSNHKGVAVSFDRDESLDVLEVADTAKEIPALIDTSVG